MARSTYYIVCFNKTFVSGLLKGLKVDATCKFVEKPRAEHYATHLKRSPTLKDAITNDEWKASDVRVVPLAFMPLAYRARHNLI